MNVATVEYSVWSLSTVHYGSANLQPFSDMSKQTFLNLPLNCLSDHKLFYRSVSQTKAPLATSLSCLCVCGRTFVIIVMWHIDQAWSVKWGVAAMRVSCTADFNSINLQCEHKSKQTTFERALYNSVNHVLYHMNWLCYTEHFVLPKWCTNVRMKERNVVKHHQISQKYLSSTCKDTLSQPPSKRLGSTRSAVEWRYCTRRLTSTAPLKWQSAGVTLKNLFFTT